MAEETFEMEPEVIKTFSCTFRNFKGYLKNGRRIKLSNQSIQITDGLFISSVYLGQHKKFNVYIDMSFNRSQNKEFYSFVKISLHSLKYYQTKTLHFEKASKENSISLSYRPNTKIYEILEKDFNLKCKISMIREKQTVSKKIIKILPAEKCAAILNNLHKDGKYKDVTLIVDGEELKAHKNILATNSPVFDAMFCSNFKESLENRVEITDVRAPIFKVMLEFLYSGRCPEDLSPEDSKDLLVAAHKYEIQGLVEICEEKLASILTCENVCQMIETANLYSLETLMSEAVKFIRKKKKKVMESEEWEKLISPKPLLELEVLGKITKDF